MLIAVADDDDDLRSMVAALLRSAGHRTLEAHDGEELLDLLGKALDDPDVCPDVLVADVKMPRLSGLGVLQALQRARWHLPVVVITAVRDESIQTLAIRLGAVGVLRKPFEPAELLRAVSTAKADLARQPQVGG